MRQAGRGTYISPLAQRIVGLLTVNVAGDADVAIQVQELQAGQVCHGAQHISGGTLQRVYIVKAARLSGALVDRDLTERPALSPRLRSESCEKADRSWPGQAQLKP